MKKVVFIPSVREGNGTGHLKRCLRWSMSGLYDGFVYIPPERFDEFSGNRGLALVHPDGASAENITTENGCSCDVAVFDMRETPDKMTADWKKRAGFIVSVDEGRHRDRFDYLIDIFPAAAGNAGQPNIYAPFFAAPGFAVTEKNGPDPSGLKTGNEETGKNGSGKGSDARKKVLVTFGGEDPAGLTDRFLSKAFRTGLFGNCDVTLVIGPLFRNREYLLEKYKNLETVEAPASLSGLISGSDIVFTSFGLTAYEALYSGKKVILINPSRYHRKLSRLAGIPEAGIINADVSRIGKLMSDPEINNEGKITRARPAGKGTFAAIQAAGETGVSGIETIIKGIADSEKRVCPICGCEGKIIERFRNRNYLECRGCGMVYLQGFSGRKKEYGHSYFFEEYKNQYGKTYLEDFNNISEMSRERLSVIKKYREKGRVLDIGCAYGPFLYVMKENGYDCTGIDVSGEAVKYLEEKLGIRAFREDFSLTYASAASSLNGKYDVVTMWYVIEHFLNTGEIIEKAGSLLEKGGILAFSTPCLDGISGTRNRRGFLEKSPDDHYTVWKKGNASAILEKYGFRVVETRSTGHHPERFHPFLLKTAGRKLVATASRFLRLGDTFEIYAQKVG